MSASCTVFKISSLIYQYFKTSRDPDHVHYGVSGHPQTTNLILPTCVQYLTTAA